MEAPSLELSLHGSLAKGVQSWQSVYNDNALRFAVYDRGVERSTATLLVALLKDVGSKKWKWK